MGSGLMMVIAAVFIITIAFSILIIKQFGSFEKKAMKAKLRQEKYIKEYLANKAEEERRQEEEERMRAELDSQSQNAGESDSEDDPKPSD
ncbi:hypothetical protein ASZ90_017287 [hydrocarbon metagenome]|uniref:Uncharacterized protein n=1 Tax=hydrocarbon metagenome TaxID=938273 RepID=A0A0W8E9I7_9ZZZZ